MRFRRHTAQQEDAPRRSLSPFPVIHRMVRRVSLTTVDERSLLAGVVAVAMILSYGGLYDFARKYHLRYPELFPVAIDLGAVAAARVAMKLTKLNHKGGTVRTFSMSLVVLSVSLNVSTIELPPFPTVATVASVFPWLWVVVPPVVGHGAPAVIAAVLFELVLLLQRVGNRRRPSAEAADPRPIRETRSTRPAAQPTPEAGQRRPAPSALAAGQGQEEESTPSPSPGPVIRRSEDELAQLVSEYLMANNLSLARRPVEKAVRHLEGSCSSERATTILTLIKEGR